MNMKIFLIYDAAEVPAALHHKIALTLPSKWLGQSVDKLLEAFVGNYNKKFADSPLDDEEMVLQVKDESPFTLFDTKTLRTSDTPEAVLADKMEVRIVRRPAPKKDAEGSGRSRCKNYGCQCEFSEASNHDAACRHHARAPATSDEHGFVCASGSAKSPSRGKVCPRSRRGGAGARSCSLRSESACHLHGHAQTWSVRSATSTWQTDAPRRYSR